MVHELTHRGTRVSVRVGIALAAALALLGQIAPAPARAEDGSVGIELQKTVDPAQSTVNPALGLTLGVDKASAIPGDTLTYTAVLTNAYSTFGVGGTFRAEARGNTNAVVAYYWDELQYCSHGCGEGIHNKHWIPFAGFVAGLPGYVPVHTPTVATGLSLTAAGVPANGVTYPLSGDPILNTSISPESTATWTYHASFIATPSQIAFLSDSEKVEDLRNVVHFEVTPRHSEEDARTPFATEELRNPFQTEELDDHGQPKASVGTVANITVTFTFPDGTKATVNSSQVAGLALLAPGGSIAVTATFKVPVPAARAAGETDAAYMARLVALEGSALTTTASASGTGFSGTVTATSNPVTTAEHLPIVTIIKSGPTELVAGNAEVNPLALQNIGGSPAPGLAVTDSLPGGATGTVTGVPASLSVGQGGSAQAVFTVPASQTPGNLTDTAAVTWHDANRNAYGPFTSSFTTLVKSFLANAKLTLAPTSAGPNPPGTTQTLTATLVDSTGAPIPGKAVTFNVTGANPGSGTSTTDANGNAVFTYTGANAGNDVAQATVTAPGVTLNSNTANISWGKPLQPIVTGPAQGNFFPNPANSCTFDVGPTSTPAFGQTFPDILFNAPASAVPHDISTVTTTTRPFTDLTVDVNGNYNGTIVAQGNGLQAGVGTLTNFYAVFNGNFIVTQAGDLTLTILHDDGYILGVGNGATRVSGDLINPPATTPFNGYGVIAAWNQVADGTPGSATIHFPAAGKYPYELDYSECGGGGPLYLVLETAQFIAQTDPLSIYVGYADGLRAGGSIFPFPWQGSPGVTFIGACQFDAGALRFDNSGNTDITLDKVTVDVGGAHFDLWPVNLVVPAHAILIVTQTGCFNFDTSDFSSAGCGGNNGVLPLVNVTRGGVTTTITDTNQVLNTRGFDTACLGNESISWQRIAGTANTINVPLPPAGSLNLTPFNVPGAIQGQSLALTVAAMDGAGNPVPNLPIALQVTGANTQTLNGTTGLNGLATFAYVGLSTGADSVQASAFISGLRELSNQGAVTWSAPGAAGSPLAPSITNPSPADGATLTKPTPISATFSPPASGSIASWSVSYQGVGLPAVQLAAANGTPPPGTLATFDPTLLPDGTYIISITATAGSGGQQIASITVTVLGNLKLGRYVTTSQDLHAPVNGFQIQVLRSYDSFDKTQGDFGIGWRLSLANFRTSSNRVLGAGGWTQYNKSCVLGLCFTAFKNSAPRYVLVVFPDQHSEIFDFTPQGGTNIFWGCTPAFTARASVGTTSTLVPLDDTGCSYTGDGNLYGSGGELYNPQRFQLTTINGTVLVLDRTLGLVSETDPNGNSLTVSAAGVISSSGPSIVFDRDAQGRITRIHGPSGELMQYSYSAAGDLQTYIDGNNNQISYTYDTAHNLKVITGPNGPIQTLSYLGGRLTSETNGDGKTSQINNDVAGQRQTVLDPNQQLTTIYTYDDLGDLIQLDRTFGSTTLTDRWTYDVTGHVLSYTDALGNPSSAVYDASGNLIKVTDANGHLFQYTYNSLGEVTSVIDPSQSTIQTYVYDSHGNRTQWNRADHSQFLYQYNAGGVVTQVTDPTGRVTKYVYDSNGHLAQITANGNNVTQVVCDASGRVTKVIDSNGKTTRYTYDGLGDLVSAVDDNNHQWLYTFNFQSQLTQIQDPLGNQRKFQYDAAGALSQVTDRDGRLIQFQYNADGLLVRKTLPGNDVTTYTYDPVGQLIEAANADSDLKFAFDAAGNITQTTSTGTATSNQPTVTLSYTYDANGNKTSLTGPDGQTLFGYNVWSQLTSVKDPSGRPFSLSYDTSFRLTSIQRPNGVNDALTYDSSDVLTGIASTHSGTPVATLSYSLDPNGRANSITDPSGTTNLTRDPLGQLTSAAYGSAAFPNDTFQYDGAGNRIANATGPSTYDSANHLLTGPGATYQYDNEGDLMQRTDASGTTRFTFNAEHRLLSITHPDSTVTAFRYDPFGRRIEINDGGAVTRYVYDSNDIHVEYDGSNTLIASYVDGTGTDFVLEMVRGGQPYYYLRDAVGSTTALVDGSGAIVNTYRYSAFGAQIVTGSVANPFTYTGREYDTKSGLYYYRDRWYDPRTGRFISEDPTPAVNLYPYAFNDPITYNDPFGAQALFEYQTRCAQDEEVFVYAGREEGGCYIGISNNFARRVGEHARAGVHVFTKVVQLSTRLGTQGLNRLGARGVEQKLIELLTKQGYNLTNKINSIAETSDAYPGAVGFGADLIQTLDLLAAVMAACLP